MISLLLGPDDFSKKEYIQALVKKHRAQVEYFVDLENPPALDELNSRDLFAVPKVFVLEGLLGRFSERSAWQPLVASHNHVVFVEDKVDRRLTSTKALLGHSQAQTKQFDLPHGQALNEWISQRVKSFGASMAPEAVEELAVRLGRDETKQTKKGGKVVGSKELFSLWQVEGEIKKLVAFAAGHRVEIADVKALVAENIGADTLVIANAIADNRKKLAFDLLRDFLASETTTDEKEAIIRLNALLAEQFRNVSVVQDFLARRLSDQKILQETGWQAGRLFVMKKIAGRFPTRKVLDFLNKLAHLDEELKSSTTPPRVLLDLIISQLF